MVVPKYQVDLFEIGTRMRQAGLADDFVAAAIHTAMAFDGVYDLVLLWSNEDDEKERDEIIADIQDMIDDCAQTGKSESVYVRFDDLDTIAKNVRRFKDELLMTVNQHGGITQLENLQDETPPLAKVKGLVAKQLSQHTGKPLEPFAVQTEDGVVISGYMYEGKAGHQVVGGTMASYGFSETDSTCAHTLRTEVNFCRACA